MEKQLFGRLFWENKAIEETFENQKRKHEHGSGFCTVFILDTSETMAGEGLHQMKKALWDILDEYKTLCLDDNVAVIGFGAETKFLHYYSNRYSSIEKCLDNIDCKGPSPLESGIILSYSCIKHGRGHTSNVHPLVIRARVVVISDGNFTGLSDPKESLETTTESETFDRLLALVGSQGELNPFTFIPVGRNPNNRILGALAAAAKGGRLIGWEEARQYARLSLNIRVAGHLLSQFCGETITEEVVRKQYPCSCHGTGTWKDINQVCEILNEKEVYDEDEDDGDFKERYSTMPCVGTRVRRGRDWHYGNQDSNGAGTVIGHTNLVGVVLVEWDNGRRGDYRYAYDLVICDEPRPIPRNKPIATGCLVRRGLDWQWGDQNGSKDSIGTVYRVRELRGEIYVRWPNGVKGNYRFGHKKKYDLFLCDPQDPEVMETYKSQKETMYKDRKGETSS
ncbi:uncharacterized protein [Magallana gigas]|uniref:uncharacterized protein isoform X1 n=1 Tax=Magallana gigas TaxID=29159 RepID=UPI0033421ABE